jgi:hypothetical protein
MLARLIDLQTLLGTQLLFLCIQLYDRIVTNLLKQKPLLDLFLLIIVVDLSCLRDILLVLESKFDIYAHCFDVPLQYLGLVAHK